MNIIMVPNKMSGKQWQVHVTVTAIALELEIPKLRWLTQKESYSGELQKIQLKLHRHATTLRPSKGMDAREGVIGGYH